MPYEYVALGQTIQLQPDLSLVALRFQDNASASDRDESVDRSAGTVWSPSMELPGESYTLVRLPVSDRDGDRDAGPPTGDRDYQDRVQAIASEPGVRRVVPVFAVAGGHALATDRVLIGLRDPKEPVEAILQERGWSLDSKQEAFLIVRILPLDDPFEAAALLRAQPGVAWAEPDFVLIRASVAPRWSPIEDGDRGDRGDPLLPAQWALSRTLTPQAWEIQRGVPAIRIAILDEGVDTRHEDLAPAVVATWDAIDGDRYQEPNPWDGHGTACAGLALAASNDKGVRGVGAGCSLVAVRIASSQRKGGPWVTRDSIMAGAIEWAWKYGKADILSNSWVCALPSSAITEAIERARTLGRGGRGCVVIAAAGNANGPVAFPATLPGVLCVAASNELDEPKTPTSSDGESWWGSCFGPEVDLAAPGVHNLTTDISGEHGYVRDGPQGSGYTATFNGTSSAAPIVAGAAGLLLSAQPGMSEADVREALLESADPVGPLPYPGGRNDRMGRGRLNVLAALRRVKPEPAGSETRPYDDRVKPAACSGSSTTSKQELPER